MQWEDSTTYSRDDKERKQTSWKLKLPSFYITITCGHIYYKGKYIMHCYALGFDTYDLNMDISCPLEEVQKAAILKCKARLNNYLMQLNSIEIN